ncbi:LysR family transcriptional regulator [Thalassovita sp.]|uniref:LysR family transcriptional regulator n=1 Tax=Thalassovita sp. TaxID=1979401 RepID=UPI0029DE5F12|nr:LysR family transcriptional regulator [Thalassovita sp.]
MVKVQHIEVLLAVENAGSIRAASKLLGKTQPAVTKALRQAEAELGVAVFKRTASGVVLTEEGKIVLRRARVIQSELRKLQEDVDQRRGLGTGRLNVTVSPLAASRIVGATIKRFKRKFPGVHVQINSGHEPIAFGPVREGQVDAVIGPEPREPDTAGLSVQFLVETDIVIVTGENSRWRNATSLHELVSAEWLMIGTRARLPILQRHFIDRGLTPPDPMVTSESIVSVLSMLQDSDLLCTFPALLISQTTDKWRIRALDLVETLASARISITTSSERPPTPAIQYFCDCAMQVCQNEFI